MLYSLGMQLPVLHSLSFSVFNTRSWLKAQDMLGELGRFTQLKQLRLYLQNTQVSRPQQQKYVYDLLPLGGLRPCQMQHHTLRRLLAPGQQSIPASLEGYTLRLCWFGCELWRDSGREHF